MDRTIKVVVTRVDGTVEEYWCDAELEEGKLIIKSPPEVVLHNGDSYRVDVPFEMV